VFALGLAVTERDLQDNADAVIVKIAAEPFEGCAVTAWKRVRRARFQLTGDTGQTGADAKVQARQQLIFGEAQVEILVSDVQRRRLDLRSLLHRVCQTLLAVRRDFCH